MFLPGEFHGHRGCTEGQKELGAVEHTRTWGHSVWILNPSQGSNLHPLHWKRGVLITGPPGKSLPVLSEGLVTGATVDEMAGWHHRLTGHEFE